MGNNFFVRHWVSSSMRSFHVTLGVTAVAAQVIGNISEFSWMPAVGDLIALFAIVHFFVHGYFHRQQQFLTNNMRTYSLPKKKIARTGLIFLASFLLIACVGMAVARELYAGTLIDKLKALILYVLGGVLSAIFGTDGLGSDKHIIRENASLLENMDQVAATGESPWENSINSIQTLLIVIGVALLIVLIIAAIVSYVRRMIGTGGRHVKTAVGRETRDREESLRRGASQKTAFLDFSASAKIRRAYRRTINRQRRRGQLVPHWMTPSEIELLVSLPEEQQYRQLHEIYEKARYSESGGTDEDAQQLRNMGI